MLVNTSGAAARKILFWTWIAFFATNTAAVVYLYLGDWIEGDNFRNAIDSLASCYETYLGLIVAFYLSRIARSDADPSAIEGPAGMPFAVALLGTLAWNVPITVLVLRLLARTGTIEDSVKQIAFISTRLSWLVASAIGYYFANPSAPRASAGVPGQGEGAP